MPPKRKIITPDTPPTLADHIATIVFWGTVIGWPTFIVIYRWLH